MKPTTPDTTPDSEPADLVDEAAPLDERLAVAVEILHRALLELPAEHPDTRLALAHLNAAAERAAAALPIPPASTDEDA